MCDSSMQREIATGPIADFFESGFVDGETLLLSRLFLASEERRRDIVGEVGGKSNQRKLRSTSVYKIVAPRLFFADPLWNGGESGHGMRMEIVVGPRRGVLERTPKRLEEPSRGDRKSVV